MAFKNKLGHDNFVWWLGVVELRNDPLNLGRCKVRIFGTHNPDKTLMPTESLPWSQPMMPVNGSLTTGTPQEGDFVFGFFFDGMSSQAPCIMGVLPGIPQEFVNTEEGFTDARTEDDLAKSPKRPTIDGSSWSEGQAKVNPVLVGEPTTSRVSRNENVNETLIGYRNSTLDTGVVIAGGGSWSEPASQYAPIAPHNRVLDTESGHLMEFDDTTGKERISLAHRTGTFFEVHPDGSKVTKVIGENYEIYLSDNNVHIKGACNITVDGDANLYVKGDVNERVLGSVNSYVSGDVTQQVDGSMVTSVSGSYDLNVSGGVVINGATINLN